MPAKRPINGGTMMPLRGFCPPGNGGTEGGIVVYGSLVGIDGVNEK